MVGVISGAHETPTKITVYVKINANKNIERTIQYHLMPVDVEYDEVVVNLKVIASITVNTKLYTKGAYLNIEQQSVVPESLRRWYRQDSRDDSIKRIDRTIAKAIAYLSKEKVMYQYLKEAKIGILNMKETYSTCVQTMARLDTILDKIGFCVGPEKIDVSETQTNSEQQPTTKHTNGKHKQHD